jgi:hypothetical protein
VRELLEDRNGHLLRWQVEELGCTETPGARADYCLVFTSDFAMRRVWHYPHDWRALSDAELLALSWGR